MISKRIKLIASLISKDQSVGDIGCDHGYLAKELRENGNQQLLICADEKKGPIDNARKNLASYENILYYQCDGLKDIDKIVNTIVIAGMGSNTIIHILEDGKEYLKNVDTLILQANNEVPKLRQWLVQNGYNIIDERIIHDYKYYQILIVEHGKQALNEKEIEYGPCLLKKKDESFSQYLQYLSYKYQDILKKIDKNDADYLRIKNKIDEINEILK